MENLILGISFVVITLLSAWAQIHFKSELIKEKRTTFQQSRLTIDEK